MTIVAIVGMPGTGKTAFASFCAIKLHTGRINRPQPTIYSNYSIKDTDKRPLAIPIMSRGDLERARAGYLFLDELPAWLDSRYSLSEQNAFVLSILQKLRKRGLSLFWTAQSFNMVDLRIRDNTNYVIIPFVYYLSKTKEGNKVNRRIYFIKQNLLSPVDVDQYLPYARIHADMISVEDYKNNLYTPEDLKEYFLTSFYGEEWNGVINGKYIKPPLKPRIIQSWDIKLEKIIPYYNTSEEIKELAISEENKGEIIEHENAKLLEKYYNTAASVIKHSGKGSDTYDIEITVNNKLMIIDSITTTVRKNKYVYLDFKDKLPLTQYLDKEKIRNGKAYIMFHFPKYSIESYLCPAAIVQDHKTRTINVDKILTSCTKIS